MPISAKEALEKVHSLDLKGNELKWFEKLCQYTDYWISNHFDGESISIDFDGNMFIPDPQSPKSQINCGPMCHSPLPHWRQGAVVKVWIQSYERLEWKITPVGAAWGSYNSKYKFEVDKRDIKLKELLEK